MKDPLKNLSPSLLINLVSIAVHAEEMLSPHGHDFDKHAIQTNLDNPEVKAWVAQMTKSGFAPVKRH